MCRADAARADLRERDQARHAAGSLHDQIDGRPECDRLIGLWLTGSSEKELRGMAQSVLKRQRPEGGWAQNSQLEPDAYGTALVLYSLGKTGVLKASDTPYRTGAAYLLRTQYPDGSWFVRSRAPKLQPYFQSGFPFEHDQWISAAGTAWAAVSLAADLERERTITARK
jgi:hypothetical protein